MEHEGGRKGDRGGGSGAIKDVKMKTIHKILLSLSLLPALAAGSNAYASADAPNEWRQYAFDNFHRYSAEAQEAELTKEQKAGLKYFRDYYYQNPYRGWEVRSVEMPLEAILGLLQDDGHFSDLDPKENATMSGKDQQAIGLFIKEAFYRVWKVAEEFRADRYGFSLDKKIFQKLQRAILYYGDLEVSRSNKVHRFHASCFAIPTAAVNIYFCFYPQMDKVEAGKTKDQLLIDTHDMLMAVGLQAWTQPLRNDETDKDVVQLERFRHHVWWVGGNALAYRSLLPVAVMYSSAEMVDLLKEVAQRGIGRTSQYTYDSAFWTEGCTEDGAGWGHGMQCLIWGYPIDGNLNALNLLTSLQGSPWENKLSEDNKTTLMNYIAGSNWYYYKGYVTPFVDRQTADYSKNTPKDPRTLGMVNTLVKSWGDSFDGRQRAELAQFQKEAKARDINMEGYPDGLYSGTRWFFNNDDLIKKNSRYHIMVNMSSYRCDGLESADGAADGYNFFPTDGMTLFQKSGNEYYHLTGAWDITATPGVTAREGMNKIEPVTNWTGYCSKYNFAAGATAGGENAVAGYKFEKMDGSIKENADGKGDNDGMNPVLYGVRAYKSWFMFGDYMLALGAGITNLEPGQEGTIRTTIDNTWHESEVTAMQGGKQIPVGGGIWSFYVGGKPVWVIQKGKFAYTVLPEYTQNAYFCQETLKTDWVKYNAVNSGKKDLPATADALRLWIDHGREVSDGKYGYVVYAGEGLPSEDLPFEVLRNDSAIQAAATMDRKTVSAVFYEPSAVLEADGVKLSVSAPCAVMIDGDMLCVTDAEMNFDLKEITVSYNGRDFSVPMPQGALCGKAVAIAID